MATNTGGGTTASLSNTPQAKDDSFTTNEDYLGISYFDVMLNDLAGNAKVLWSIDNGPGSPTDLISQDLGRAENTLGDKSLNGANIWITSDGKVGYDAAYLNAAFKASLQALPPGQSANDTFTYAIRMANGTLSWATVTIVYQGVNDPPVAHADINGTDLVIESGVYPGNTAFPGDSSASGNVLANDTDVDSGAVLTVKDVNGSTANVGSSVTGTYGSVTINANGGWTYNLNNADPDTQALAQGQAATEIFNYTVTDEHGATSSSTLTITITGTNDAPVAVADSASIAENQTVTANVLANDTDVDAGHVFTLTSATAPAGKGNASVVGNQLQFNPGTDFDHLAQGATETVNVSYSMRDEWGATSTSTLTITVTGTNDDPVAVADVSSATEGASAVTGSVATNDSDPDDGASLSYALNAPVAGLTLNPNGSYSFDPTNPAYNHLAQGATTDVIASYTVSDGLGGSAISTLTITVTGTNDAPVITSDGGGASASVNVAENSTAVTTVTSTDVDGPTASYSIIGGADAAKFTINSSTGALSFVTAPNFESPADVGGDNVYDVVVQASDGSLVDSQAIAVTVANVNEAPTITSNGGGASASVNVAENGTAVTTVAATDPDAGTTLTYSIVGGADQSLFTINASTGALSFVSAPNFEAPTDAGANNVYDVIVQASDGTLVDTQAIAVTVTDVNAAPVITSNGGGANANVNVAENSSAVTTVVATDDGENNGTITYSIVGGADQSLFTINVSTGALSFFSAPNFESPTDSGANNVYDVTVRASDGTLSDDQAIAVTVTNVNETPTITSNGGGTNAAVNVAENSTAVTTVVATDPDAGTTITYSIAGGADQSLFTINSSTGALSFGSAPNFESPTDAGANNVYDVIVQASDGTLVDTQAIAVTVTNVNAAPVITSNGGGASANINVAENSTAVTTVVATDDGENSNTLTYSIAGGLDSAKFTVNSSTGALSFIAAPNFEAPTDNGANNVYDVIVRASDGSLTDDQAIAITVTNVNEAPTITSNGGGASATVNVAENSTAVTTVIATDPDAGTTLTYSIAGGADAGKFTINSSTGALSFVSSPDFENPTDSGTNNVYDVTVRASDGTLFDDQAIAVTVTDVAENSLYLAINISGPEGSDDLGFANFTVTIGSTVYHLSDLVVVSQSGYFGGATGFHIGPDGGSTHSVVFQIPGAPSSGAVQVHFDYTSANGGNTTNDGPVFTIGTTPAAATLIANYANTTSPVRWVDDVSPASARTISFNYTTTGSTVNVSNIVDPIILDLGAHGISLSNTVLFDMDGDGHAQGVSWTTGEDGVLAVDLNGDGKIDSGNEILSPWFNGGGFAHSLDALASLDSNADGLIDANDAAYGALRVWIDANSDGVTDAGELLSLSDLGITSISLGTVAGSGAIDGQNVLATGSFNYADGSSGDFAAVELTETVNTRVFNGQGTEDVVGTDGDDLLFASNLGNAMSAGGGNDVLYSGGGNDTLSGGDGNDRFVLANAGVDTIADYAAGDTIDITSVLTVASDTDVIAGGYLRVTTTGLVQVDLDGGGDNWVTLANVNPGSAAYSIAYVSGDVVTTVDVTPGAPPIGIDMDGDGQVSFLATDAGATFDYGYGKVATAWVAGNDGILVRDANHDGQASATEIVFATSGSDLQGLAVYDSNHDGQLSATDAAFADFAVWQDANSNGVVDNGEMTGLTALGIASLSLSSDGIGYSAASGDVQVVGTGSYTRTDGSTGVLADAVFATGAAAEQKQALTFASNSNAALISAIAAAGLAASEPLAAATVHGDEHASANPVPSFAQTVPELSPVAASAVEKLHAAEQMASSSEQKAPAGSDGAHVPAEASDAQLDSSGSQQAPAPSELLAGSEAPAHEQIVSATPLAAPSIVMPSAEQLAGVSASTGSAQHDQVLGHVLADALHGGEDHGADLDTLLASLPDHGLGDGSSALAALASHSASPGMASGMLPVDFGVAHLSLDMLHMDAPPPA